MSLDRILGPGQPDRRLVRMLEHSSQACRTTTREGLRRDPSRGPLQADSRTFATAPVINDPGPREEE